METIIWAAPALAACALLFAVYKSGVVSKASSGNERMSEIAGFIHEGARAFLFAEYKILVWFIVILTVAIGLGISWMTAICFVVGAIFSILAGYSGMNVATKANVRTAAAASDMTPNTMERTTN